jgi:hypothetical protein
MSYAIVEDLVHIHDLVHQLATHSWQAGYNEGRRVSVTSKKIKEVYEGQHQTAHDCQNDVRDALLDAIANLVIRKGTDHE